MREFPVARESGGGSVPCEAGMKAGAPWATHGLASLLTLATGFLLVTGGLVVSTESSLAVPDWPLSYGMVMPPMVGGIFYEHGHRMVASGVGLLTIVLALFARFRDRRRWVFRMSLVALAAVCLQGLLGGLTVLFLLPRPVSVVHACLAQIFFCLVLAMAILTSPGWARRHPGLARETTPTLSLCSKVLAGSVFLQLLLGAGLRMTRPEVSIPLLMIHIVGAFVVIAAAGFALVAAFSEQARSRGARRLSGLIGGLVGAQFLLGLAAVGARMHALSQPQPTTWKIVLPTAHHGLGALILGLAVSMALITHARASLEPR